MIKKALIKTLLPYLFKKKNFLLPSKLCYLNETFLQVEITEGDLTELTEEQQRTLKLTLPKTATYPYSLSFPSSDYGMSGTPPHDPDYPQFKNEYPSNVKLVPTTTVSVVLVVYLYIQLHARI